MLRLKDEFRALRGIVHPNLIRLYELFVTDGACFFTMELLDGVDVVTYVRTSSGPPERFERLLAAGLQLADGLLLGIA